MNQAWLAAHRKAVGAFLTVVVAQLTALLALGILSGPVSHDIALGLTIATPVLAFFGVKYTAPNKV